MKRNIKNVSLILIALALMLGVSACTNTYNETTPLPSVSPSVSPQTSSPAASPSPSPLASPTASDEPAQTTLSNQESAALATRLDTRISQISEVDESVTVVLGNQSISGVTFNDSYKGELTDRIKAIVADCVKEVSPTISDTVVTSSKETYDRIAQLRDKQKAAGSTTDDIKKEFDEIKSAIK